MTQEFILSTLTLFISSSCFGYLIYFIVENLGAVSYTAQRQDEKRMLIMLFSGLNIAFYLLINHWLGQGTKEVAFTVLLLLLCDIAAGFILANCIAQLKIWIFQIRKNILGMSRPENRSARDYLFNTSKVQTLFIFDMDNNLINAGYLDYQEPAINNYFDLTLYPLKEPVGKVTIEKVDQAACNHKDARILVDFEKQIKIYVFRDELD